MKNKPVTIKEIAKTLNISVSSVSRALHNHPSIGLSTKQKVKALADKLGYVPNQTAISFQKGKTYTIGVILPELSESFFSSAISAIEDTANQKNYTVLFAQSHDSEEKEVELVEKMKNHRVDGLIVSLAKNTKSFKHFTDLKKYNIPVVFFDRTPPEQDIHYVTCNMQTGTVEAVNYLLQKGHRSIGMINGPNTLFASKERKEGYIEAMSKNRLKFDPSLIVNCELTEESTIEAINQLLNNKRKPTAIVTFNDYIALYAIKHCKSLGIKINKDIDFVSYSNLPLFNYMDNSPIASVEQFPYQQGQKATEILLNLLVNQEFKKETEGFYHIFIASQLVENQK